MTREEITSALNLIYAVGEAIRELKSVPNGELYALSKLSINEYTIIIQKLVDAKLITNDQNLLVWIGPKKA